jgi:hypothetical protein
MDNYGIHGVYKATFTSLGPILLGCPGHRPSSGSKACLSLPRPGRCRKIHGKSHGKTIEIFLKNIAIDGDIEHFAYWNFMELLYF